MEKQDVINVLEFVKYNQLRTLQWKAAYLRYQINMLETEKTEAMNHLFKLKRMIYELQPSLTQKRDIALMNQESRTCDNTGNSYPVTYSEPDTSPDSIRIS
jgi:hypothetical protein